MGHFYYKSPEKPDENGFLNYRIMYRNWRGKKILAKEIKVPTCGLGNDAKMYAFVGLERQVRCANEGLEKIPALKRWRMTAERLFSKSHEIGEPIVNERNRDTDRKLAAEADVRKQLSARKKTQAYGNIAERATPPTQRLYSPAADRGTPSVLEIAGETGGLENAVATPDTIVIEACQGVPVADGVNEGTDTGTYELPAGAMEARAKALIGEEPSRDTEKAQVFDMNDIKKGGSERNAATRALLGDSFLDEEEEKKE